MFCESYRKALGEAAARGVAVRGEAGSHLAICAGCRQAFAAEQALLQRIDAGLRSLLEPEIPASLVPGVRGRIAVRRESRAAWRPSLVYAAAAAAICVVVIVFAVRNKVPRPEQKTSFAERLSPAKEKQAVVSKTEDVPPSGRPLQRQLALADRTVPVPRDARNGRPEVLVSADDQLALQRYIASLTTKTARNAAAMKEEASAEIKPLEIAELDVKRLFIEPLESADSN